MGIISSCQKCCSLPPLPSESSTPIEPEILSNSINLKSYKNYNNQRNTAITALTNPLDINSINSPNTNGRYTANSLYSNLIFRENDVNIAVNQLISSKLYYNLINGENLYNIINRLNNYSNSSLFEIIEIIISITKDLYVNEKNISFHQKYINDLHNFLNKKLSNQNLTINDNDYNCKDLLINLLADIIEIYHFLRCDTAKNKKPYDTFLWKNIPDLDDYFNKKLLIIKENIEKLPLIDDKMIIVDSLV
jgi:hypothetical protein